MIKVTVEHKGPFFETVRRDQIFADIERLVEEGLAFAGMNMVRANTRSFKNPTGFWRSQIDSNKTAAYTDVINTTIYTRWLEGVSPRNRSTSFKGYQLFERAELELDRVAQHLADQIVADEIKRLN